MRQLVAYAFEAELLSGSTTGLPQEVSAKVEQWLGSKGTPIESEKAIHLKDGRLAKLERMHTESNIGAITEVVLTEPTANGRFRTSIGWAATNERIAVTVVLAASSPNLAPIQLEVHCPRLVRDLLAPPSTWNYCGHPLSSVPVVFDGTEGGDDFVRMAWSSERSLPIVAISDEYGAVLHPGIVEALAADLSGLAIVAQLDPPASWSITRAKNKEWSCYGGAIRLYWPGLESATSPYHHPLWTPSRLLDGANDTESAAFRLRNQLRRLILSQSAFSVSESTIFAEIRNAAREEEASKLREKIESNADFTAQEYLDEWNDAEDRLKEARLEIEDLKQKIRDLRSLQYKPEGLDVIEPDSDTPPSTVMEAVEIASLRFKGLLVFSPSVQEGIAGLARDAGPPSKILSYLSNLAECTKARREGGLGDTVVKWLGKRGVNASVESETIRTSSVQNRLRTWDDGRGGQIVFDLHLKPTDGTAPDRCVRIYFCYDEVRKVTIVGWVGRHP